VTLRRIKNFLFWLFAIRPGQVKEVRNELAGVRRGIGAFVGVLFGLAVILGGIWSVVALIHYFSRHS
jgi:hypothetical protein